MSNWTQDCDPTYFRPAVRRYKDMTNEELQGLFDLRASKIKLDPKGFWDCKRTVYWSDMIPKLAALYEIMLEIQSRYPKGEILPREGREYLDERLLPLLERPYALMLIKAMGKKIPFYGLHQLETGRPPLAEEDGAGDGQPQPSGGGTETGVSHKRPRRAKS